MNKLISRYRQYRSMMDPDVLLLQHHWLEMGKDLFEPISASEWADLCSDRLGIHMKKPKLTSIHRKYCKHIQVKPELGVGLHQATGLLHLVRKELVVSNKTGIDCVDIRDVVWEKTIKMKLDEDQILQDEPCFSGISVRSDDMSRRVLNVDSQGDDVEMKNENELISAARFLHFLRTEQKEYNVTLSQVNALFERLNSQTTSSHLLSDGTSTVPGSKREPSSKALISRVTFMNYLTSDANDLFDPIAGKSLSDMSQPLSSYWINTSHDTYLTKVAPTTENLSGGTVTAPTPSVHMFMLALQRGCRCLELDVWNGTDTYKNEPVLHFNVTPSIENPTSDIVRNESSILLRDVLYEIKRFIKLNPDSFPIILMFEDHCSLSNQTKVANYLKQIFDEDKMLYIPSIEKSSSQDDTLPSPAELIGKVVVKCKRPLGVMMRSTVIHDDYDDENDLSAVDLSKNDCKIEDVVDEGDDEDDIQSSMFDFEQVGRILDSDLDPTKVSPEKLLVIAQKEAEKSRKVAQAAESKAFSADITANEAEEFATSLLSKIGMAFQDADGWIAQRNGRERRTSPIVETIEVNDHNSGQVPTDINQHFIRPTSPLSIETGREKVSQSHQSSFDDDTCTSSDDDTMTMDEVVTSCGTPFNADIHANSKWLSTVETSVEKFGESIMKINKNSEKWIKQFGKNQETNLDVIESRQSSETFGSSSKIDSFSLYDETPDGSRIGPEYSVDENDASICTGFETLDCRSDESDGEVYAGEGMEVQLINKKGGVSTLITPFVTSIKNSETVKVMNEYAVSVQESRSYFEAAERTATKCDDELIIAGRNLRKAEIELSAAEENLSLAIQNEIDLVAKAKRVASEALSSQEQADVTKSRVEQIQDVLAKCREKLSTAEIAVATAVTEAKISKQRAQEAESRYANVKITEEKNKAIADEETKKEEDMERDTADMQKKSIQANETALNMKKLLNTTRTSLQKVDRQIESLEQSSQYRAEIKQKETMESLRDDDSTTTIQDITGKYIKKHKAKLEERAKIIAKIKKLQKDCARAESARVQSQKRFDEIAHKLRIQSKKAASARKQADQSAAISEQHAEIADEERDAAEMRAVAREKAEACVQKYEAHCATMEKEWSLTGRAAIEAEDTADKTKLKAEKLASEAELAKDLTLFQNAVKEKKSQVETCKKIYGIKAAEKKTADAKATEAKKVLLTCSDVYYRAKLDANAEKHRMNARKQMESNAVKAYNRAIRLRQEAHACRDEAIMARSVAGDKAAAERHAREYRIKKAIVRPFAPGLAELTLLNGTKFKYWEKSLALPYECMHSLSEGKILHLMQKGDDMVEEQWIEFNKNHMCRSFPSRRQEFRETSKNFNPVLPWSVGCQFVAMNHQVCDAFVLVNDGRFRANGSTGYVLKPPHLTELKGQNVSTAIGRARVVEPETWNIKVLSGYNIPKPKKKQRCGFVNPRVRIAVYDKSLVPPAVHLTKTVKNNILNPIWNEREGSKFTVKDPTTAIILISVWDHDEASGDDEFIAASSLPISCMREGYRSVPLFDFFHLRCGAHSTATLLVKVAKFAR